MDVRDSLTIINERNFCLEILKDKNGELKEEFTGDQSVAVDKLLGMENASFKVENVFEAIYMLQKGEHVDWQSLENLVYYLTIVCMDNNPGLKEEYDKFKVAKYKSEIKESETDAID